MRILSAMILLLLFPSCAGDIPRTDVIFISIASSYGTEGSLNYLENPPGDQRALSEQLTYISSRKKIPFKEYLFLEDNGRMSISGDERPWGRQEILSLLENLESEDNDLIIFHYSGHGDSNGSMIMPDGTRLNPDDLLYRLRRARGMKCAFIDSCYSGRYVNGGSTLVNGEIFYEGQLVSESFANALIPSLKLFFTVSEPSHWNTWVLSAATSSQLSYDSWDEGLDRQIEFGAFTYYLLKAFGYRMDTGTPALPEGRLTFSTIYDTIKSTRSETLWRRATPQATLTPVDLVLF